VFARDSSKQPDKWFVPLAHLVTAFETIFWLISQALGLANSPSIHCVGVILQRVHRGDIEMKKLITLMLPLMLSACWTGPDFYADAPSVQPIPAGKYKVVRIVSDFDRVEDRFGSDRGFTGEINTKVRISYAADGDVIVEGGPDGGGDESTRLITLDEAQGLYVAQVDPGQGVASLTKRIYGLVRVTPDGYRLSVPLCDGTRRIKPGSRITVGGLLDKRRTCSYPNRETFETAMRKFADDPVSYTEYRRVKG
jgi:hypothetical protein